MESHRAAPIEATVTKPRTIRFFPVFIALLLIIHGLFNFTPAVEAFIAVSIVSAIASFVMMFLKENEQSSVLSDGISKSVFCWCFLVCISSIWAVNPQGAFISLIGYGGGFFFFIMGKAYSHGSQGKAEALSRAVGYSGAAISILSIEMASTGIMSALYTGPLSGLFRITKDIPPFGLWVEGSRMQSIMGLPNLFATFAAMCFFVSLWLILPQQGKKIKSLDIAAAISNGVGFLLSGSRGGFLAFGAAVLVYVAFGVKGKRLQNSLHFLAVAVWCLATYLPAVRLLNTGSLAIWPTIFLSLYLPRIVWPFVTKALNKLAALNMRKLFIVGGIVTLLAVLYILMPGALISRFQGGWADANVLQRFEYWRDGMRLFALSPVFGLGGGSFQSLVYSVSDSYYVSRHVHNHYIQIMVENGIVGFLILLSVCIFTFLSLRRVRKPNNFASCYAAAVSIMLIHSFVEASMYNLLNIAVFLLLLGIISGVRAGEDLSGDVNAARASKGAICLVAALLAALLGGRLITQQFVRVAEARGTQSALQAYRVATVTDPLNASNYKSATLMRYINDPDSGAALLAARFVSDLERNTRSPWDCFVVARYHLRTGNVQSAVWFFERYIELSRTNPNAWDEVLAQYFRALRDSADSEDDTIRRGIEESTARLSLYLRELNESLRTPIIPNPGLMVILE